MIKPDSLPTVVGWGVCWGVLSSSCSVLPTTLLVNKSCLKSHCSGQLSFFPRGTNIYVKETEQQPAVRVGVGSWGFSWEVTFVLNSEKWIRVDGIFSQRGQHVQKALWQKALKENLCGRSSENRQKVAWCPVKENNVRSCRTRIKSLFQEKSVVWSKSFKL